MKKGMKRTNDKRKKNLARKKGKEDIFFLPLCLTFLCSVEFVLSQSESLRQNQNFGICCKVAMRATLLTGTLGIPKYSKDT